LSVTLLSWDAPGPYAVAFSTRGGGVSEGSFDSLNLGLLTHDEAGNVDENRRRLCEATGADPARLAMNRQVHAATVNRAEAGERGREGDGLWSDERGVPMLKVTADCLPIALARRNGEKPALALLHAGRLGLLQGIVEAGVEALGGKLAAVIGPGIGPCCYEVGPEVLDAFADLGEGVADGRMLDLPEVARRTLARAGVEQVESADLCTFCEAELFFSHRRDQGKTGRMGNLAWIEAPDQAST
jgi:polyphenol oxidase